MKKEDNSNKIIEEIKDIKYILNKKVKFFDKSFFKQLIVGIFCVLFAAYLATIIINSPELYLTVTSVNNDTINMKLINTIDNPAVNLKINYFESNSKQNINYKYYAYFPKGEDDIALKIDYKSLMEETVKNSMFENDIYKGRIGEISLYVYCSNCKENKIKINYLDSLSKLNNKIFICKKNFKRDINCNLYEDLYK